VSVFLNGLLRIDWIAIIYTLRAGVSIPTPFPHKFRIARRNAHNRWRPASQ
jgi:hypothetical protein